MTPAFIGFIAVLLLLVLIFLKVPVGLGLAISGAVGILLLDGPAVVGSVLGAAPYSAVAKYVLIVIPMFVLLGATIANSPIGAQIFSFANRLVGRLPGGLPATTVLATAAFSGISGSSAADVAAFGRVSVREMSRRGYSTPYAAAVVAAAGAFAALIPPSIVLVIYAVTAEVSVGKMILAGVVPGAFSALVLMTFVVLGAVRRGRKTPEVVVDDPIKGGLGEFAETERDVKFERYQQSWKGGLAGAAYAVILFSIVIGGVQFGIFTTTEAAAIAAGAALLLAVIVPRPRHLTRRRILKVSMMDTASVSSMIFLLLIGAAIFNYFLTSAQIPRNLARWVSELDVSAFLVLGLMLVLLLPLGMVLDGLSMVLIITPIYLPIVLELGFDPIWFGILMIKMAEISLITPPVGINVFVIAGIIKYPKVEKIFASLVPFVLLDIGTTIVLFIFPALVLWLPSIAATQG